jgi:hypothetical protein
VRTRVAGQPAGAVAGRKHLSGPHVDDCPSAAERADHRRNHTAQPDGDRADAEHQHRVPDQLVEQQAHRQPAAICRGQLTRRTEPGHRLGLGLLGRDAARDRGIHVVAQVRLGLSEHAAQLARRPVGVGPDELVQVGLDGAARHAGAPVAATRRSTPSTAVVSACHSVRSRRSAALPAGVSR